MAADATVGTERRTAAVVAAVVFKKSRRAAVADSCKTTIRKKAQCQTRRDHHNYCIEKNPKEPLGYGE
jgi:hypothetical protein